MSPSLHGLVCQFRLETRMGVVANVGATETIVHRDLLIALAQRRSIARELASRCEGHVPNLSTWCWPSTDRPIGPHPGLAL
jgi:hypothetical protein